MQALIQELAKWFSAEMDALYEDFPFGHIHDGVLMGCPVWGKEYRERFERYCLPSLFAPENLAALSGRCRLVLFSEGEGRAHLLRMLKPLEAHGIDFVLRTIPAEVIKHDREIESYPILGCVQNILIQMAGRYQMALHVPQPDHLYPERYAPNMFRLGQQWEAVVQCGLCLDIDSAGEEIEGYRTADKELIISSDALGDMAWRHLHRRMRMLVVNDAPAGKMPHSHFLLYKGRDRLRIHSPHMNPVWLSPWLCLKAEMPRNPKDLIATIDTRLPGLIDKTPTYIVQPEDEMMIAEVSTKAKSAPNKYVDFDTFSMTAWKQIGFSGSFQPFFDAGVEIAIAPQDTFWGQDAIEAHHRDTIERMLALKPIQGLEAYQKLVGTWKPKEALDVDDGRGTDSGADAGNQGRRAEGGGPEAPRGGTEGSGGRAGLASVYGREGDRGEEGRAGPVHGEPDGRPAAHRANGSVPPRPEAGL